MVIMNSSTLSVKTKEKDKVLCRVCKKGIMVPINPAAKENHCFVCNNCGARANIDNNVEIK